MLGQGWSKTQRRQGPPRDLLGGCPETINSPDIVIVCWFLCSVAGGSPPGRDDTTVLVNLVAGRHSPQQESRFFRRHAKKGWGGSLLVLKSVVSASPAIIAPADKSQYIHTYMDIYIYYCMYVIYSN